VHALVELSDVPPDAPIINHDFTDVHKLASVGGRNRFDLLLNGLFHETGTASTAIPTESVDKNRHPCMHA
jgi:hypothetical protein